MSRGEQSSMRGGGQVSVETDPSALDEATALAFRAEAEILQFDQNRDGEAVVKLGHVDLRGSKTGALIGRRPRFDRAGVHQVAGFTHEAMPLAISAAENLDALSSEIARALRRGDDHSRRTIGNQGAIQNLQRRADRSRTHDV